MPVRRMYACQTLAVYCSQLDGTRFTGWLISSGQCVQRKSPRWAYHVDHLLLATRQWMPAHIW